MTSSEQTSVTPSPLSGRLGVLKQDEAFVQAVRAGIDSLAVSVTLVEFERLEEALTESSDGAVLLPVRMPLEQVFAAARSGSAPGLDGWLHDAELLLGLCRKARRRIILVDTLVLDTNPIGCIAALAARLGVSADDVPAPKIGTGVSPYTPLHRVLASGLVATMPRAQKVAEELSAMITGPSSFTTPTQEEYAAAVQELATMAAAQDSLNEALEQTREMFEDAEVKANDLAKQVQVLEGERDAAKALTAELKTSEEARTRLEAECVLLRESLRQLSGDPAQQSVAMA